MADVDMSVRELTRVTGVVDVENDGYTKEGTDGTPFYFPNDGDTFLAYIGGGAAGDTITFVGYADEFGRVAASFTFTVAAGAEGLVGPFLPSLWNGTDGRVQFTLGTGKATDFFLAVRLTQASNYGV